MSINVKNSSQSQSVTDSKFEDESDEYEDDEKEEKEEVTFRKTKKRQLSLEDSPPRGRAAKRRACL